MTQYTYEPVKPWTGSEFLEFVQSQELPNAIDGDEYTEGYLAGVYHTLRHCTEIFTSRRIEEWSWAPRNQVWAEMLEVAIRDFQADDTAATRIA